jgi:hypothetical protein
MDKEGMADDEVMIDDEQDSEGEGEIACFFEELQQNKSLKEVALHGSDFFRRNTSEFESCLG